MLSADTHNSMSPARNLKSPSFFGRIRGFTLVEVMISMVIGTILIGGIINIFVTNTKASKAVLEMTYINQEMRTLLEIMSSDIRKAGYWAGAKDAAISDENPFGITAVSVNPNCILFTYDTNNNSTLNAPIEEYGFRLNSGVIETRLNGAGCAISNTWTTLSNIEHVEITKLAFTVSLKCTNISDSPITDCSAVTPDTNDILVEMRSVDIELNGKLASRPEMTLALKNTITVANDSTKKSS